MSTNKYWWENGKIQQCTKLRDCRRFLHIICVLFQNNKRDFAFNYAWLFEKEFLIFRNPAPHSKWFNLIQSLLAGHSLFSKAHHLWKLWPEIDVSSTESIRLLAVSYWLVKGVLCFVITTCGIANNYSWQCDNSKFEWGLTLLWSTQLFHQGSTPSIGIGPTQGQRKTLTKVGFEPTTSSGDLIPRWWVQIPPNKRCPRISAALVAQKIK